MKLKEWADKQGISYLTAWRWFKAHDARLANAYQSDSGTIIVPDDSDDLELSMGTVQYNNDVMSAVLKKTVELSKNNGSVEDFAAWILSNFSLKSNVYSEKPKYSRIKPKPEDVQKHFKQFLKPKHCKPKMFVADPASLDDLMNRYDDLAAKELDFWLDSNYKIETPGEEPVNPADPPEVESLMKDFSSTLNTTSSAAFQPTQKEIESSSYIPSMVTEKPRRRKKSIKNKDPQHLLEVQGIGPCTQQGEKDHNAMKPVFRRVNIED